MKTDDSRDHKMASEKLGRSPLQVCPNCGYPRVDTEECIKCGIVYRKFKKRIAAFSREFSTSSDFLLFIKFLIAGSFLLGIFLWSVRNIVPGGVETGYLASISCLTFTVVFICVHWTESKYLVQITEKELTISGIGAIPWENVYTCEWHSERYDYEGIYTFNPKWIDITYLDDENGQVRSVRITHKINNLKRLFQEIDSRKNAEMGGVRYFKDTNYRKVIEYGIWLLGLMFGFVYFLIFTDPNVSSEMAFFNTHPTATIVLCTIMIVIGVLLMIRWRK